mmetsp:Transcript_157/g.207  ORF Transcript_157/g.207 Transcript_157/m.207 type:complete len:219 (-) Transcript_157:59-715(-)
MSGFSLHNEESWQDYYGAWNMKDNGFREWYLEIEIVHKALQDHVDCFSNSIKTARVLHSGTGTSILPFHLHKEGFKSQVGIDFSSSCIQSLQTTVKETKVKGLDFKKMDVRELGFEDGSFDVIVDKGTLDCVMLTQKEEKSALKYLAECERVLKPGGQLAIFSLYPPKKRQVCVKCEEKGVKLICKAIDMPEAFEMPDAGASHLYILTKPHKEQTGSI